MQECAAARCVFLPCSMFSAHPSPLLVLNGADDMHAMRITVQRGLFHAIAVQISCRLQISGGLDESIRYWDIRTGQEAKSIPAHSDPVTALDLSRCAPTAIYVDSIPGLSERDKKCQSKLHTCLECARPHGGPVSALVCRRHCALHCRDGQLLVSASTDGLCRLWDFSTGYLLRTLLDADSPPIASVQFSPNNRYLLAGCLDAKQSTIKIWDWQQNAEDRQGRVVRRLHGHQNVAYFLRAQFVHGSNVLAAAEDGSVCLWNINSRKVRAWNAAMAAGTCVSTLHPGIVVLLHRLHFCDVTRFRVRWPSCLLLWIRILQVPFQLRLRSTGHAPWNVVQLCRCNSISCSCRRLLLCQMQHKLRRSPPSRRLRALQHLMQMQRTLRPRAPARQMWRPWMKTASRSRAESRQKHARYLRPSLPWMCMRAQACWHTRMLVPSTMLCGLCPCLAACQHSALLLDSRSRQSRHTCQDHDISACVYVCMWFDRV